MKLFNVKKWWLVIRVLRINFALTSLENLQEYFAPRAGKPQNKHELKEHNLIEEHFFL